jgi:hypothetical protein
VKFQRSSDGGVISGRRRTSSGTLARMLRDDLDWIVMKAMDKDRERRYSSAAELAADIRRHLLDEPVIAGAPSRWYRIRKLIKRNRGAVIAGSVALALLVTAFFVASGLYWRERRVARSLSEAIALSRVRDEREAALRAELERQRDEASALAREAGEARARAEWRAYLAAVGAVQWARDVDPASAPARLLDARLAGAQGHGGWELGVLGATLDQSSGPAIHSPAAAVAVDVARGSIAALPDGRIVRVAAPDAEPVAALSAPIGAAGFSDDARFFVFRSGGTLRVSDLSAGPEPIFSAESTGPWSLSQRGTHLAQAGRPGRLVRLPEGIDLPPPPLLASAQVLAFSREGDSLAGASMTGEVTLLDIVSGREQDLPGADRQVPRSLAFSARGDALACAGDSGDIVIWPIESGRARFPARLRGHRGPVNDLAFAPGGGFLASASDDGTVRLWNLGDLSLLATLRGHTGPVRDLSLGLGPTGLTLVSSGDDAVRTWELPAIRAREAGLTAFAGHPVEAIRTGDHAAVCLSSGQIVVIDFTRPVAEGTVLHEPGTAAPLAISPDGIVVRDGADLVWRAWQGHERTRLIDVKGDLVASHEGRLAVASGATLTVIEPGGPRHVYSLQSEITSLACADSRVIVGLRSGEVREFSGAQSRLVGSMVGDVCRVRLGPRGEILAGSRLGEVLVEGFAGAAQPWIASQAPITELLALENERLLVADDAGGVTLWHSRHREAILTLQRDDAPVRAFLAMPPGDAVLALREDGTCALWGSGAPSLKFADPGENLWLSAITPCDATGAPALLRAGAPAYLLVRGTARAGADLEGEVDVSVNGSIVHAASLVSPAEGARTRPLDMILGPLVITGAGPVQLRVQARSRSGPWPGPATDDELSVNLIVQPET